MSSRTDYQVELQKAGQYDLTSSNGYIAFPIDQTEESKTTVKCTVCAICIFATSIALTLGALAAHQAGLI